MDKEYLKASIIIPIYNDESHLKRCLDSITAQTYPNFECLLIDDGSTDSSRSICTEYTNSDSRFTVFHKDNEGISKTRQFGLTKAAGDYIFFIDSDDWVEPSFLETPLNMLSNTGSDILFSDFYENTSLTNGKHLNQTPISMENSTILSMILGNKLFSCLWNVVIKKDFCLNKNICFNYDTNYGEDSLFIMEFLLNNPKVDYLNKASYHHFINPYSYTRKDKKERYLERLKFLNLIPPLFIRYKREALLEYNSFPLHDKYEALSSKIFSKKEYRSFSSLKISHKIPGFGNMLKYFLLLLGDSFLYYPARSLASFLKQAKRIFSYRGSSLEIKSL